ncbi:MAG: hypothetical protein IPG95_12075 [Saprospiraceae bacterium]|nr:hypothetical protein [Saprospiraceae bacterium]
MPPPRRAVPLKFNWKLEINGNIYSLDLRHGDAYDWINYAYEFLDCYEIILNNKRQNQNTVFDRSAITGICSAIQDVVCSHEDTILFYWSDHDGMNSLSQIWNNWSPSNNEVICITKNLSSNGSNLYFGCFMHKDQSMYVSINSHIESMTL